MRLVAALALAGCHAVFDLTDGPDAGTPDTASPGSGGKLDTSFGGRGWVNATRPRTHGHGVAVDVDGTITAVGYQDDPNDLCFVMQLLPTGSPAAFGNNGEVGISLTGSCQANSVSVLDGMVVFAGAANGDLVVMRLQSNGVKDSSFGADGLYLYDRSRIEFAEDVVAGPSGIFVAGGRGQSGQPADAMLVLKLRSNGALDTSWGGTGEVEPIVAVGTAAVAMASSPKLLFAGTSTHYAVVVQLLSNGTSDGSFGTGGSRLLGDNAIPNYAYGLVTYPGGMIVGVQSIIDGVNTRTTLHALDGSGDPDPDFNSGAPLVIDFGTSAKVTQLALQPDGKVVVAATLEYPTYREIGLARVSPDGTLDPSFGTGGIVRSRMKSDSSFDVEGLVVAGGQIVIAGTETGFDGMSYLYVARYLP